MIGLVKLDDRLNDFGAEQVILVRDDEAKGTLQAEIGDIALVLTILESKGMEFDDVLLYNFFSDGGHTSSYRVLYLLLDHRKVFFDAKKHAVSNSRSTGIG
jgi:ATP-dependent exoDNAse (exonuclease V) beta subunit